jgi:hypothetical protein
VHRSGPGEHVAAGTGACTGSVALFHVAIGLRMGEVTRPCQPWI